MADSTDYFDRKVEELKRHNQQLEAQFQAAQYDDIDSPVDDLRQESPMDDEEEDEQAHYRYDDAYEDDKEQFADEDDVLEQATEVQELKEQLDETSKL